VTLKGLDINGLGTGAQNSLVGIKILSAKEVNIIDNRIYRFKAGIAVVPVNVQTDVLIANNHIHDNGIGVIAAPGNSGTPSTTAVLRHNTINDNVCGIVVGSFGANASTPDASSDCGTAIATGINSLTVIDAYHNGIHFNGTGVFVRGTGATAGVGLAWNTITWNRTAGLTRPGGGLRTYTPASNVIANNGPSDTFNSIVDMQ
jgi:hypothetical protein